MYLPKQFEHRIGRMSLFRIDIPHIQHYLSTSSHNSHESGLLNLAFQVETRHCAYYGCRYPPLDCFRHCFHSSPVCCSRRPDPGRSFLFLRRRWRNLPLARHFKCSLFFKQYSAAASPINHHYSLTLRRFQYHSHGPRRRKGSAMREAAQPLLAILYSTWIEQ